ncbi:hypothetical protein E1265_34115, partial [Streptomyces sp. 8K308]
PRHPSPHHRRTLRRHRPHRPPPPRPHPRRRLHRLPRLPGPGGGPPGLADRPPMTDNTDTNHPPDASAGATPVLGGGCGCASGSWRTRGDSCSPGSVYVVESACSCEGRLVGLRCAGLFGLR